MTHPSLWDKSIWLPALLLAAVTILLYLPIAHHPFLNLDDNQYVTANPHVQAGLTWDTVEWAFSSYWSFNWHPLTWLSHALDVQMFGLEAAGPHLVNLALHVLNVLLLFWVLARATGCIQRSAMVAALFALHTINVESVAWIAERKNLLSMLFLLLALGAYRWYAQRPGIGRYSLVALWFAFGLMAKPQIITLPFVLLLWDYWPLRRMSLPGGPQPTGKRFSALVLEKVPLFALCLGSAVLTMQAQQAGGAVASFVKYPLSVRMENALVAYARYLGKLFWPSGFAPMYPHPGNTLPKWQVWLALLLMLAITEMTVELRRRRRYLLVGWLWFVGTLVPMIGLVQVGHQSMADRYAYLPFIGLFIMLCWGVPDLLERFAGAAKTSMQRFVPGLLAGISILALCSLCVLSRRQLAYWGDNVTLWSHAEDVIGPNSISENRIGDELLHRGQPDAAMQHFKRAVEIQPSDADSDFAIAVYEQRMRNLSEAVSRYKLVVSSSAGVDMKIRALTYMSYAYRDLGDSEQQRECLAEAERLRQ